MTEQPAEAAFAAIVEDLRREPGVDEGTGFGKNPGLRADGSIFAMLVAGELVVKLAADRCAELAGAAGASPFAVGQRRMREWVSLEHDGRQDWAALAREALGFARDRRAR